MCMPHANESDETSWACVHHMLVRAGISVLTLLPVAYRHVHICSLTTGGFCILLARAYACHAYTSNLECAITSGANLGYDGPSFACWRLESEDPYNKGLNLRIPKSKA
jgi:hypothetical protein